MRHRQMAQCTPSDKAKFMDDARADADNPKSKLCNESLGYHLQGLAKSDDRQLPAKASTNLKRNISLITTEGRDLRYASDLRANMTWTR